MKKKNEAYELSKTQTILSVFLKTYNKGIPKEFPRASAAGLRKFKNLYPTLFKHGKSWSVAEHRKKLIDWLFANRSVS
jgi:hypothetical protein